MIKTRRLYPYPKNFQPNWLSQQAEGLLSWWPPLASGKLNTLYDLRSGFNGALGLTTSPAWVVDSEFGYILNFDGADDVVNFGANSIYTDLGPVTLAAWIYPRTIGENNAGRLWDKSSGTTPTDGWLFSLSATGTSNFVFQVDYVTTNMTVRTAANTAVMNTWTHVALAWNGSASATDVHIYINGVEAAYQTQTSGTDGRITDAGQSLLLGNSVAGVRTFDGYMTDFRLYNTVKSEAEIFSMYNAPTRWDLYGMPKPLILRRTKAKQQFPLDGLGVFFRGMSDG